MKITTVIGARPQFVKAAVVSREIKKHSEIKEMIIHTGQHFDANMSDVFFKEMDIPAPDYNLNINSMSHGAMTGRMMEGIESILIKDKPDYVLVYGDTDSTLAAAMAAVKLHIPLAHVEAGLRSFNMSMPEEINRIITDRISSFLFCPTSTAVRNLEKEGFNNFKCRVVNCGDVMYDASMFYSRLSKEKSSILSHYSLKAGEFVLATLHRAENTDNPENLSSVINALNTVGKKKKVVLPIHPRTKNILAKHDFFAKNIFENILFIDPVGYYDMIELMKNACLIMTDSGGVQKEAYFFKKICITMRTETEWTELVENGYNFLTGADYNSIIESFEKAITMNTSFETELYGDGNAAGKIIDILKKG